MLLVAGKRMCLGGSTWPSPNVLAKKPTISPASCLALLTCAAANGSSEIARRRGRRNLPASTSSLQRKENVSALYPTLWACKILRLDLMRGLRGPFGASHHRSHQTKLEDGRRKSTQEASTRASSAPALRLGGHISSINRPAGYLPPFPARIHTDSDCCAFDLAPTTKVVSWNIILVFLDQKHKHIKKGHRRSPRPRFATTRFKAQTTTLWRCCLAKKSRGRTTGDKRRRRHDMRLSFKKDGLSVPCRAPIHHICWPTCLFYLFLACDVGTWWPLCPSPG